MKTKFVVKLEEQRKMLKVLIEPFPMVLNISNLNTK